jgi:hypothetical protein
VLNGFGWVRGWVWKGGKFDFVCNRKIPEGLKHSGIETYGLCRLNQHDHVLPERNVRRRRAGRLFGLAVVFDEYICFTSNFTLSRLHLVQRICQSIATRSCGENRHLFQTGGFVKAKQNIHVLNRLSRCTLHEVVDCADCNQSMVALVYCHSDVAEV